VLSARVIREASINPFAFNIHNDYAPVCPSITRNTSPSVASRRRTWTFLPSGTRLLLSRRIYSHLLNGNHDSSTQGFRCSATSNSGARLLEQTHCALVVGHGCRRRRRAQRLQQSYRRALLGLQSCLWRILQQLAKSDWILLSAVARWLVCYYWLARQRQAKAGFSRKPITWLVSG
jgi:hypothetical protein